MILEDANILVTGGTGSFGSYFIHHICTQYNPRRVVVFSRNEYVQYLQRQRFAGFASRLRWFVGDVRDEERLETACDGVDYVVHAAALKHVDVVEYNPIEAVLTNILGTANVLRAAVETGVKKVVFLSTDKAVSPINLYGATKLCGEKLMLNGNFYRPIFNVVRYGNVMGARGSVLELFNSRRGQSLPITDPRMTRFWMSYQQAVDLVLWALEGPAGLTYVGKVPSFGIPDLAAAFSDKEPALVGLRPGEKLHETLIHEGELPRTRDMGGYYVILPEMTYQEGLTYEREKAKGKSVAVPYTSDTNPEVLAAAEIKRRADDTIRTSLD